MTGRFTIDEVASHTIEQTISAALLSDGPVELDGVPDLVLETPRWSAWLSARGGRMWATAKRIFVRG